jgi:hypothetical protein
MINKKYFFAILNDKISSILTIYKQIFFLRVIESFLKTVEIQSKSSSSSSVYILKHSSSSCALSSGYYHIITSDATTYNILGSVVSIKIYIIDNIYNHK